MKRFFLIKDSSRGSSFFLNHSRRGVLIVMVMVLTLSVKAQGGDRNNKSINPDQLAGSWVMDYTKSKNSARSEVKDKLSKMNSSERAKFKSDREGREYLFESNGNLVIQRPGLSDFSAKWELITGNKKIKITDQNGVVRTYIVVRFQSKRLVLSSIGDNGSNKPVFDQLFLKKQ